jgi:hypothetical protein
VPQPAGNLVTTARADRSSDSYEELSRKHPPPDQYCPFRVTAVEPPGAAFACNSVVACWESAPSSLSSGPVPRPVLGNRPPVHPTVSVSRCLARCWGTGPRFTLQCPGASPGSESRVSPLTPRSLWPLSFPVLCESPDGPGMYYPPRHGMGTAHIARHVKGWAWHILLTTP